MPKIIEFEGTQHEFPDDFSDDEIGALLGQSQASPSVAPGAPLQAENPNPLEPILMDGREEIAGLQTGTTPEAQQSDRIFAARLAELGPDISRFTAQVGAAGELSIPPTVRENDVFLVPDPQDNSLTFWRRSKDGAMPVEREEFIQRVRQNSYFTPRKTEFEGPEDTGLTRGESARGAFAQGAMSNLGGALEGAGIVDRMILPSGAREIAEGRMALGSEIQEAASERFPTNPIFEGTILQKMAQGAGSSLPFAVTGTLGGFLGPATSAFLGSLQSGAEQYKRAKAMGVSEEKAKTAFGVGALGGATEAFGIGRTGARVAEGIGSEVAEEMGQEGIQGFFGLLAQANYDPKTVEDRMKIRQVAEAAENMLIGGLTAGVIKLPSALTQKIFDSAEKPEPAPPGSAKGKAQRSLTSPVEIPTVPPEGLRTEAEQEGTVPTTPVPPSAPTETPAPVVEETEGTKEQQPIQPPVGIAGPALVVPEGPERVGTIGQTHADVRKAAIEEDLDLTEADHLFKLTDGRNVSRAEAWQIAKSQGLIKPEVLASREKRATPEKPPELQSQDLIPLTFSEPATQQGPLSDVLESVNVYLHGPTDITNELRPDVPSVNVTDRVTGNTFQLPQDVTPEEIVTELNKRKRTFKVPEVTLPESFRGITQPLPFSPKEETTDASPISSSATLYGDVFQPEVAPEGQGQVPVPEGSAGVPTPPVTPPVPPAAPPAAPTPAPSPSEDPLSIQNAVVDKKREARGLAPRMTELKRSFGFLWNQAMQAVAADPAAGTKLIESLAKNNRTPSDAEQALLLHEMVVRENDYHDAIDTLNNAKDEASRERAQEQLELAADRNQQAYDVFDSTGTSSGRSLNARKMMANRDFSLARMNAETRAIVNEGKPLSKEQLAANKKLSDELSEVRTKLAAIEAKNKILEEQRLVDILKSEEKTRAKEIRAAARRGKSVLDLLEEKKDAAMKRIIDRRGKLNVTIDPLNIAGLVDEAIIGSYYIAKGLKTFTEWSAQMLKDFGNRIEPYLPALFQQSQQYHDANAKLFSEEDLVGKAKNDAAAGKNVDPKLIFDLARQKVNQGITELHNIMEAVTTDLQGAYPGITEREVRDEFTGYGKVRYPSKKEDLKKLRELKRIGQLQSAIEDVMKRQAPKRSGAQRDAPTQDVRDKMRELRELMKENGIETTSPEQQLKSVNDARATALKNQIEDLDKRIRTGEKPPAKTKVPDSPEVERLRAERDAMKQLLQDIEDAANPKKTPEERAEEQAIKNVERSIAELDRRIREGDIAPKPTGSKVTSPKLEGLRAQRDAMSAYLAEMRREASNPKTPEQRGIEAAEKARDRWDRILKGEATPSRAPRVPLTQEETNIRLEIEAMRGLAKQLRDEARPKSDPEALREKREIAAAEKAITEYERRAKALDFSPAPKMTGPVTARVAKVRAARDAARDAFEKLREAAKPKVDPEKRQLEKDKRAIKRRMEKLQEKIDKGDYTKTERRAPLMDKEKRELQFQEQKIREKFYRGLLEAEMKKRTPIRKVWDNTMDVLGLLRATKLSIDLGALGRQGGLLARGNPKRGVNALRAGLNAMRSEERHYGQLRDIWERDNGALYKASKLYIPDPTETKLSRLEEEYMSTLVRKVPLLAGSERGHVALLARLRADSFDAIVDAWFDGKPTAKQARAVAEFVNIATGRGELGKFASAVPALNLIFNATSYYASRVQLLGYLARSAMPGSWTGLDPKVANAIRYELAKGIAGNVVWWSLMALAAKALWPEDELEFEINPTSSDFGKIRSGKIVIDPLMGLTQYATLFSRIFSGQMKTKGGTLDLRNPKYGGPTTESVIGTFAGQRLSPNASMFRDLLRQSDYDRRKMSPLVFAENALPISINETYELMRSAGIGPGSALTMAMLLGDGVRVEQDYPGPLHSMFGVKPEYVGKKK